MNWKDLNPPLPQFRFQAKDVQDIRLSELIETHIENLESVPTQSSFLISYPDDEGIKNNGGRIGAAWAGDAIRKYLYKMTWPSLIKPKSALLYDLGSLNTNLDFDKRHSNAKSIMTELLKNHRVYSVGGGHDYAYPDGASFLANYGDEQAPPLIINFDAHLDVRPLDWGANSGTPFYQLLKEFPAQFRFVELGLQKQCNSAFYWQWAKKQGTEAFTVEEMRKMGGLTLVKSLLQGSSKTQKCFISVDIDVFAQYLAMGSSQSWANGLMYHEIVEIIDWLLENKDVRLFSVYEVSPPLDIDNITTKLAAGILHFAMTKGYQL
jgi:formiminoglutamase